jgi:hypothetical protein
MPLSKQVIDEKNRTFAKSGEIYNKSLLSGQCEQPLSQQRFQTNRIHNSGPSSIERHEASLAVSGPSSIDSGNKSLSLSRNSGHLSLDSNGSITTVAQSQGSPKSSSSRQRLLSSSGVFLPCSKSTATTSTSSNGLKSTSFDQSSDITLANSNSNGSITLQVTNSTCLSGLPKTKIFVQNSPVHTSTTIAFENGKFMDRSNLLFINNDTVANSTGEAIVNRKTATNPSSPQKHLNKQLLRQSENLAHEKAVCVTMDSLSLNDASPGYSLIPFVDDDLDESNSPRQNNVQSPESNKCNKNLQETLNNRKFSVQMGGTIEGKTSPPVYNKMLKNHYNQQTNVCANVSPAVTNNNINVFCYEDIESSGSLKVEKSGCNFLNSNPTINSDSLLNIFHKNIIAVGSEPNLITMNKQNDSGKQKINNCTKDSSQTIEEKTPSSDMNTGLYSFPSLSDLSFNFTSLHAQKILKGGSSEANSIDTLVEVDMNKHLDQKSNIISSSSALHNTDYGII